MMAELVAFLPCRAGSERVPRKNTRPFAGVEGGLLRLKLEQLAATRSLDRILVSTNDPEVIAVAEAFADEAGKPVQIDRRPDHLCSSQTSTDELIRYAADLMDTSVLFWTHVTSPFVGADAYDAMSKAYADAIAEERGDSLMAVSAHRTFLWDDKGPINYDRTVERWPRTQTLKPIFEINSAAFVIASPLMREVQDRIGRRPVLHTLSHEVAVDIDWEEDFNRAEALYRLRRAS